jgi:hypothetical protein
MLVALLLFLMDPGRWWLATVALVAGAAFAVQELRSAHPFLDLRIFGGNVPLLVTYLRALLAAIVSYAFLYGFTQWLEEGRGLSPSVTGLVLLPTFGVGIAVSALSGRHAAVRGKLVVGALAQALACALLLLFDATSPLWLIVTGTVVMGVPQGLVNLANQNAIYHQADPERIGASAGLQRTFFTSGRSSPRPRPAAFSANVPTPPACTTSPSCSSWWRWRSSWSHWPTGHSPASAPRPRLERTDRASG